MEESLYSSLVLGPNQVRLLDLLAGDAGSEIKVRLRVASLDQPTPLWYFALSYTWGDSSNQKTILCNGHKVSVNYSLFSALSRLRAEHGFVTMWIDAICINQADFEERAAQVRLMTEIYRIAQEVVADLGEAPPDVDELFALMHAIGAADNAHATGLGKLESEDYLSFGLPPPTDPVWRTWQMLLSRPYFQRVWTIQEFAIGGRRLLFKLGTKLFPWYTLYELLSILERLGIAEQQRPMPAGPALVRTAVYGVDGIRRLQRLRLCEMNRQKGDSKATLELCLRLARSAQCTDPKDRVYSMLSLVADAELDSPALRISYDRDESVADVFARATIHIMNQSRHDALLTLYSAGRYNNARLAGLPSWIPNWAVPAQGGYLGHRAESAQYRASDARQLDLCIDTTRKRLQIETAIAGRIIATTSAYDPVDEEHAMNDLDFGISVILWVEEAMKLRMNYCGVVEHRSIAAMHEAFWQTLIVNVTHSYTPAPAEYKHAFDAFLVCAEAIVRALDTTSRPYVLNMHRLELTSEYDQARKDRHPYAMALHRSMFTKRFAMTDTGFTCMVPAATVVGDTLALFSGACVPFVVREYRSEETSNNLQAEKVADDWILIGECYAHGIMNNEMSHDENVSWHNITLI